MDVTSGAGTVFPSGAPEFTSGFLVDECKIQKSEKINIFCSIIGARREENGIHYKTS
jgi:hypothetical protein